MGKRHSGNNRMWEVEAIISSKYDEEDGELLYEIKWKGFKDTTWEPERCLENCPLILQEFKQRNGATWIDDAQSPREKESVEKSTGADEEEAQSSPSSSKQKKSTAKSTSYSPSDSPSKMAKKSPTPMDIIPLPPSSADKTKGARNQSRQSRILSDTKSSDENEAKFEDLKVDIPTKKKAKKEPAGEEDEGERVTVRLKKSSSSDKMNAKGDESNPEIGTKSKTLESAEKQVINGRDREGNLKEGEREEAEDELEQALAMEEDEQELSFPQSASTPKRSPRKHNSSANATAVDEKENDNDDGGKPTAIVTCFQDSNEVTYVVRWEENNRPSQRLIPSSVMRVKWPQMVIDFLQAYMKPGPAVLKVAKISENSKKKRADD